VKRQVDCGERDPGRRAAGSGGRDGGIARARAQRVQREHEAIAGGAAR